MSIEKNDYANEHLKKNLDFYFLYNGKDILGAPSGIKSLDKRVEGFFGLVGLTGEPGKGKTSLAIQTAVFNAFILNKPVLYISLEVNKDMLITKMISHLTGIPLKKILKGGMNYEESKKFVDASISILNNKNLIVIDTSDATFNKIEGLIYDIKDDYFNKYGVEEEVLVVLDYLNIFKDVPEGEVNLNSDNNDKTKAQMTKLIQIKNDTKSNWIIILAKNKQGYKKQDMGSIKGSGDLEYGFETLISLEDPDEEFPRSDFPENPATGFKEVNTLAVFLKARWESTKGGVPLYFNGTENRFCEP
jgi:replicative DNA helicase